MGYDLAADIYRGKESIERAKVPRTFNKDELLRKTAPILGATSIQDLLGKANIESAAKRYEKGFELFPGYPGSGTWAEAFIHDYLLGGADWTDLVKKAGLDAGNLQGLVDAALTEAVNENYEPLARLIGDVLIDAAFNDPQLKHLENKEKWQNLAKQSFHGVLGEDVDWGGLLLDAVYAAWRSAGHAYRCPMGRQAAHPPRRPKAS